MSTEAAVDHIGNVLHAVGAPYIDPEDMRRLYKGRVAEVLDFAASNLTGRQAAVSARNALQIYRDHSRAPGTSSREDADPLFTRMQRAEARVKAAQIALQQSEQQLKKPNDALEHTENEAGALQEQLEDKRLTTLLLSVLERKEAIRKERIKEVIKLLSELRSKVGEQNTIQEEAKTSLPTRTVVTKPLRVEHTRDALTSLQSHSIRLTRLSAIASDNTLSARTKDAEARVLEAIAHSMGLDTGDPDVIAAYETSLAAARSRARASVEYHSPLPHAESSEDLQDVSQRIIEKERRLQDLADEASALTLACVRALQTDSVFVHETAPQLRGALEEEAAAAQGHVDALRRSIINRPRPPQTSRSDSLGGGRSYEQTLSDIECQFANARDAESFLEAADALVSPDPSASDAHAAIAASYAEEETALSARLQKLLQHKAAKADAGHALVEEVERLIAEVGIIAGTHN
ncbi:uncharacterized protein TRAVEDRAFT_21559 [Trametes versicolor FP-101664 SS1]|uniref:uncharacterized protein n=1 Tax=Trametes versicolor (strain FP-101664) TaxID=717944 RepID=UPI0004623A83|nr:uncharacterized protein TRAVEDRAFT_21559 [Trametes versicolor FP-101664 SS1]EIW56355.1 hypothetical protein TRAVEDRAFT_21559 [Trametes versicolor FP-101664 SS1]